MLKAVFLLYLFLIPRIGLTEKAENIALILPDMTFETIAYLNIEAIHTATGESYLNRELIEGISWGALDYLENKIEIKKVLCGRVVHRFIGDKNLQDIDLEEVVPVAEGKEVAQPHATQEFVWIIEYQPILGTPFSAALEQSVEGTIRKLVVEKDKDLFCTKLNNYLCLTEKKETISKTIKQFYKNTGFTFTDDFPSLQRMFSKFPFHWSYSSMRYQFQLSLLLAKRGDYPEDQIQWIYRDWETFEAFIKYLDFSDSKVEYAEGTAFLKTEYVKETLPHWKEKAKKMKYGSREIPSKQKMGPFPGLLLNYIELSYDEYMKVPTEENPES